MSAAGSPRTGWNSPTALAGSAADSQTALLAKPHCCTSARSNQNRRPSHLPGLHSLHRLILKQMCQDKAQLAGLMHVGKATVTEFDDDDFIRFVDDASDSHG